MGKERLTVYLEPRVISGVKVAAAKRGKSAGDIVLEAILKDRTVAREIPKAINGKEKR